MVEAWARSHQPFLPLSDFGRISSRQQDICISELNFVYHFSHGHLEENFLPGVRASVQLTVSHQLVEARMSLEITSVTDTWKKTFFQVSVIQCN